MKNIIKIILNIFYALPAYGYAQLGARIEPDYPAGDFSDGEDFWMVLALMVIIFIAPGIMVKNLDSNISGIKYWKWVGLIFGSSFLVMGMTKSYENGLMVGVLTAFLGLMKNEK